MRTILSIIMILVLLVSFVACGGEKEESEESVTESNMSETENSTASKPQNEPTSSSPS